MSTFSKKMAAGFAAVAMMAPAAALAETTVSAEAQAQIQGLLQQIRALQQQLAAIIASSTASGGAWANASTTADWSNGGMPPGQMAKAACIALNRNLRIGSQGEDVKNLQKMLREDSDNGFNAEATGYFGPLTARAVIKFQMRAGIVGSANETDGSVGPMTRSFFERRCGQGLDGMQGDRMKNDDHGGAMMMEHRGEAAGTIIANAGSSITIQDKDGKSVMAYVTASTTVKVFTSTSTPATDGTLASLTVGSHAVAEGPQNADGSIQAMHVNVAIGFMPPPLPRMEKDKMQGGMNVSGMLNGWLGNNGQGNSDR